MRMTWGTWEQENAAGVELDHQHRGPGAVRAVVMLGILVVLAVAAAVVIAIMIAML